MNTGGFERKGNRALGQASLRLRPPLLWHYRLRMYHGARLNIARAGFRIRLTLADPQMAVDSGAPDRYLHGVRTRIDGCACNCNAHVSRGAGCSPGWQVRAGVVC